MARVDAASSMAKPRDAKEPIFLIKVGLKKGAGSFRVQNNIDFGPPRGGRSGSQSEFRF